MLARELIKLRLFGNKSKLFILARLRYLVSEDLGKKVDVKGECKIVFRETLDDLTGIYVTNEGVFSIGVGCEDVLIDIPERAWLYRRYK